MSQSRARVVVYTAPICPYCIQAKRLLAARNIEYAEIDVADDPQLRERMIAASGRRTVPQIFIDGKPVGGFDELTVLDRSGELAALLSSGS